MENSVSSSWLFWHLVDMEGLEIADADADADAEAAEDSRMSESLHGIDCSGEHQVHYERDLFITVRGECKFSTCNCNLHTFLPKQS